MTALTLVAVGGDFETFAVNLEDNTPFPVIGLFKGTKEKPEPILGGNGFAVQEDNVMMEFNIPPADTAAMFDRHINQALTFLTGELAKKNLAPLFKASLEFDPEQLKHPQALTFGCDPDFNVWERKANEINHADPLLQRYRFAGDHIHISFLVDEQIPNLNDHLIEMETVVMGMDMFLGVPSILRDKDAIRRKFYGRAGAFRPKTYGEKAAGVEYRVLSPFWIASELNRKFVFDQVVRLFHRLNQWGDAAHDHLRHRMEYIRAAINQNSIGHAQAVMAEENLRMFPE